jgi:hypothetical protein
MSYTDYVELCIAILKKEGTILEFMHNGLKLTGIPVSGALIGTVIYVKVDTDRGYHYTDITKIVSYLEDGVKRPFPRHKDTSQKKIGL